MLSCLLFTAIAPGQNQLTAPWKAVVQNTLGAARFHVTTYERNIYTGKWMVGSEEWREGSKYRIYTLVQKKWDKSVDRVEMRNDGRRDFWTRGDGYGFVRNSGRPDPEQGFLKLNSVSDLFSGIRLILEKPAKVTSWAGRKVLEYDCSSRQGMLMDAGEDQYAYIEPIKILVNPQNNRVFRFDIQGEARSFPTYAEIEYPTSIEPKVFQPPRQDIPVLDLDQDSAKLKESMSHGRPFGKGNVLRAVVQDPKAWLEILWTGTPANGYENNFHLEDTLHVTVEGRKVDMAVVPYMLSKGKYRFWFHGEALCGISVHLDKPVGNSVSIQFPIFTEDHGVTTPTGAASVQDFPVIHTDPYMVMTEVAGFRK